jgi:hypothetical protein
MMPPPAAAARRHTCPWGQNFPVEKWCKSKGYIQVRRVKRKSTQVPLCPRFRTAAELLLSEIFNLPGADSGLWLRLIEAGSYRLLTKGERGFQLELDPASWFDLNLRGGKRGYHG